LSGMTNEEERNCFASNEIVVSSELFFPTFEEFDEGVDVGSIRRNRNAVDAETLEQIVNRRFPFDNKFIYVIPKSFGRSVHKLCFSGFLILEFDKAVVEADRAKIKASKISKRNSKGNRIKRISSRVDRVRISRNKIKSSKINSSNSRAKANRNEIANSSNVISNSRVGARNRTNSKDSRIRVIGAREESKDPRSNLKEANPQLRHGLFRVK